MGFRFRRSFKLFPGIRINLSKSGFSASVGPRGMTTSFGQRGVRTNVGIAGTGLSYSKLHGTPTGARAFVDAAADPERLTAQQFLADAATAGDAPRTGIWTKLGWALVISPVLLALALCAIPHDPTPPAEVVATVPASTSTMESAFALQTVRCRASENPNSKVVHVLHRGEEAIVFRYGTTHAKLAARGDTCFVPIGTVGAAKPK